MSKLQEAVKAAGHSEDHWKQLLVYSASVFQNCGNYKSFGDTKFVPEFDRDTFVSMIRASDNYKTHQE